MAPEESMFKFHGYFGPCPKPPLPQPPSELVRLKAAVNKLLDYIEAHGWGTIPEPHDSIRELCSILDRTVMCHGDVNCSRCGRPMACDGRHAEKQYCSKECEAGI